MLKPFSARYFQAAEHQLSSETGQIRLTSVQARLCQCFYLLSQSRVNHCWALFGTTAHLILALGIHRKRRLEAASGVDMVELECRKRVFWCAYGLDSYLSAALGRPRTFHDEDVDQVNTCQYHLTKTDNITGIAQLCQRFRPHSGKDYFKPLESAIDNVGFHCP